MEVTKKAEQLISVLKAKYIIEINVVTGADFSYVCSLWENGILLASGKGNSIYKAVKAAKDSLENTDNSEKDMRTKSTNI